MKNAPSTSSHECIILMPFIFIEHVEETHEQNSEDGTIATQKSKRQMIIKSFGDDYIVYTLDDTPRTIKEAYLSPNVDF
jgi:hypothetical protein